MQTKNQVAIVMGNIFNKW